MRTPPLPYPTPIPTSTLTPRKTRNKALARNGMKKRDLGGGEVSLADPTFWGLFLHSTRRASYSYTGV